MGVVTIECLKFLSYQPKFDIRNIQIQIVCWHILHVWFSTKSIIDLSTLLWHHVRFGKTIL